MDEMVLRQKRRRRRRMLDERRFAIPVPTSAQVRAMTHALLEAAPGFLLAMADLLGMPSGLHAAYIAGLAALERPFCRPMAGAAAALLLRLLSGLDPRWEGLLTLAVLWLAPLMVLGRGNAALIVFTAASMLPTAVRGCLANTAAEMLLALGAVAVSSLSAPLMYRGVKGLLASSREGTPVHLEGIEDRLCVGYLGAMLICGGARVMVAGVNLGAFMAAAAVLLMAMNLGIGAGCAGGLIAGMALSLQGLPLVLSTALALGGFFAGMVHAMRIRWATSLAFALAALIAMLLSGGMGVGCGCAVMAAALGGAFLPRSLMEGAQAFFRRFFCNQPVPGDAYAASMLAAWEQTVEAMALAMPAHAGQEEVHDGAWWERKLCEGCPDVALCGCMTTDLAAAKAQTVWDCREANDGIWQDALEELRGLGCQRLYHLRQSMDYLRQEDAVQRRSIRSACDQRAMLVTHLTAMAGAARRFALLSTGESWWDEMIARRIRRELSQAASPIRLVWVRRVQGHVQAAFELQYITGARRQAEELCGLVGAVINAPMRVSRVDGDRVQLAELPLLRVDFGVSAISADSQSEAVCGDTAWCGRLQDGRYMAALSDGMGHGKQAALASQQTVELLRLCLDAGYSRRQTLTAVNGMMLLSGHGERFTTVDLMTIDLWNGQMTLDKLGAAGSWVFQQGKLQQVTGDALPLGILEHIESRECSMRLAEGDAVILMTDGVEEAFSGKKELEEAIWLALDEGSPAESAHSLLRAAAQAAGNCHPDDQTVAVIRIANARTLQDGAAQI